MESTEEFQVGQVVALRADLTRRGPIVAELPQVEGRRRYRVFHSAAVVRDYFEDQLVRAAIEAPDLLERSLLDRKLLDPATLRAGLVATRLANPQLDHIYALRAARIQYIPFQFKPVLRILRADRPRLLLADDVGVGKTIEAGLIMKELETRQSVERVLVLCPKALTTKWRKEMRRFDEDFRVLSPANLRYCLDEVHLDGEWPVEYARSIVHYELFRLEQYLVGDANSPGLLELDPPPRFDLVIADEAHHLRTPGTGSHRLIQHLGELTEALILMTATPVQLHADDLFVLLNVLRPDLFPDKSVFADVIEPNRHITRAMRLLRSGQYAGVDWQREASDALRTAASTSWGRSVLREDPRYEAVMALMDRPIPISDEDRVRCVRELEELHSLAHLVNRTRRRDIGRFTVREPHTVSVSFTPAQRRAYDALLEFRRGVLLARYDPRVVRLVIDTLERQAASSINALATAVDEILDANGFNTAQLTDDPEVEEDSVILPDGLVEMAESLRRIAKALPREDPKFEELFRVVKDTMFDPASPGKVLVFSFFLHTIAYLQERLSDAGIRVGVVTGRVDDAEREALRERFRLNRSQPEAVDVLLSSEIGCEGLDYEFCDRLVNYDIPWNPMRLEQRIGRIDRFGQRSEKILIFNFITPGTVEERIFFRCFERLGIFEDAVGDLEEILGELVQDLTRLALDTTLTIEQADARSHQLADNALRLAHEQRRLEEASGDLLGLEEAFVEEVDDVLASGRYVAPSDLEALVASFLREDVIKGELLADGGRVMRLRLSDGSRRHLAGLARQQGLVGQVAISFVRRLESGGEVLLTFDQATALDRRDVDFVTPVHPLARLATAYRLDQSAPLVGVFRARSNTLEAGTYVFACEIWETIAARAGMSLVCLASGLETGEVSENVAAALLSLLAVAEPYALAESRTLATVLERLHGLDSTAEERRRSSLRALGEENEALITSRLGSLEAFYENRLRRVRRDLEEATEQRIIRMRNSELGRIEAEYEARRLALERARDIEIVTRRVAAGVVEVVRG